MSKTPPCAPEIKGEHRIKTVPVDSGLSKFWLFSTSGSAPPADLCEGVVSVDAFLVYGADDEAGDALVSLEEEGNISYEVFDEDGIVVGLHGDVAFIRALE